MPHVTRWRLFVDETGDFSRPNEVVAVAGLLVDPSLHRWSPEVVRATLRTWAPDLAWPFHASFYNRPVAFVLSRAAGGRAANEPDFDAAAEVLGAHHPDLFNDAIQALRRGVSPRNRTVGQLDRALRRLAPACYAAAEARTRRLARQMQRYLDGTINSRGAANDPPAMVFAAAESWSGALWQENAGDLAADSARYEALLSAMLERVHDVVAAQPGAHHVFLQILTRYVLDPDLDARVPLHVRHVHRLVRRWAAMDEQVRLVTEEVPRFDERAHPATVLADFAANRCGRLLGQSHRPLPVVEQQLRAFVGGLIRSDPIPGSHLAAVPLPPPDPKDTRVRAWVLNLAREALTPSEAR